jgi:hypothetical protein
VCVFMYDCVKDSAHVAPLPTTVDEFKTRITGASQECWQQCSQKVRQEVEYRTAERSKSWICGRSLSVIVGSNPAGGMVVVSVVCCQVEVCASD